MFVITILLSSLILFFDIGYINQRVL